MGLHHAGTSLASGSLGEVLHRRVVAPLGVRGILGAHWPPPAVKCPQQRWSETCARWIHLERKSINMWQGLF